MLNDTSCCLAVSYLHWGLLSSEDRQMGDKSRALPVLQLVGILSVTMVL